MTRIKICGITKIEDALKICELGAWAIGFIFYPKSKRYIAPENVKLIIDKIKGYHILKVGVFVNFDYEKIIKYKNISGIDVVQLHGNEPAELCYKLSQEGVNLIKAFGPKTQSDLSIIKNYDTEYVLFDAPKIDSDYGGTGRLANWEIIKNIKQKKIILAGGINENNILQANDLLKPYAFDLSSSVEVKPGIKDHNKLSGLFSKINSR